MKYVDGGGSLPFLILYPKKVIFQQYLPQCGTGNGPLCPDGKTTAQSNGKPTFLGIRLC